LELGSLGGSFVVAQRDEDGTLRLSRDAIGHRTLYWGLSEERLFFASTVAALLATGAFPRKLDARAVAAYLSYAYVPGERTLVQGIHELLPGEELSFRDGRVSRRRIWDLPSDPESFASEADLERELRGALDFVVHSMLPDGEPVAASLSGGIDSSLVVALAQKHRGKSARVRTFSITFGKEYRDELAWSGLVASHTGTEHTVVELTPEAVLGRLDDTIACMDKPNGDPLTVPNALLFREMSRHAAVVLNGEGGDPCFGGPKNLPMVLSELYQEPDNDAEGGGRAREQSYLRAHLKCFDDLADMFDESRLGEALSPPLTDELVPWFEDARFRGLVQRLMAINIRFKGGHHILPKVDALSRPFGVLPRSPLFSRAIVEMACRIPPELKLRGATEKYLLKRAVRDLLPESVVDRPKSGMMVPVEGWFQHALLGEAKKRVMALSGGAAGSSRLFRPHYLERLLSGKLGGLRPRRGVKIWLLITLESHLRALKLL
jgi:asparagine synthase (glutamine-hydrolysing)